LRQPSPGYSLAERLARMFPEQALLETTSHLFDVRAFAAGKQCAYVERADVFQHYTAHYDPDEDKTLRTANIVWWNVSL
jgi:hypothetical protein